MRITTILTLASLFSVFVFADSNLTCPVSALNDTFFPGGKPAYLTVPAIQPNDTVCPDYAGQYSCCDATTLSQIKEKFTAFKTELSQTMSQQLQSLQGAFANVSRISIRSLVPDSSGERLRLIVEKITYNAKQKFAQLKAKLTKCYNSMFKVQAGFLCAACSTSFPVVMIGSQPQMPIHSNTVKNLSNSCQDYAAGIRDAIDEYHRVKAQIIDYVTGEIGTEDNCSCSGTSDVNSTAFNVTVDGVAPPAAPTARRVLEEAEVNSSVAADVQSFMNGNEQPRNDSLPNVVNNQTYEPEKEANQVLSQDTKNVVNKKNLKRGAFNSLKGLATAIFSKLFHGVATRNYRSIVQTLKAFVSLNEFEFEEGLKSAINLSNDTKNWKSSWFLITQLMGKLAADLVFNMPWTMPNPTQIAAANQTPSTTNTTAQQTVEKGKKGNATAPKEFKFSFFQRGAAYARYLNSVFMSLPENGTLVKDVTLPYIQNDQLLTVTVSAGQTFDQLVSKEASLLATPGVIIVPVFECLSILKDLMMTLGTNGNTFATQYLSQLTADDKKYIRDRYFPSRYYRRHPDQLVISLTPSQLVNGTINYFNQSIVLPIKQAFAKAAYLFLKNKAISDIAVYLINSGRSERALDAARKLGNKISDADLMLLQACEANRRSIKQKKTCDNESECYVCFVTKDGKVQTITLIAGDTIADIDETIATAKRKLGMFGRVDVFEMQPYDDDEAIETAKCPRAYSARTKLCLPKVIEMTLSLGSFDEPPAINDDGVGEQMLTSAMNGRKFKESVDIVMPVTTTDTTTGSSTGARLLVSDSGDMSYVSSSSGVDLANVNVGLKTTIDISDVQVSQTTMSSSAATFGLALVMILFSIIVIL